MSPLNKNMNGKKSKRLSVRKKPCAIIEMGYLRIINISEDAPNEKAIGTAKGNK
jgi:hypothetical protein